MLYRKDFRIVGCMVSYDIYFTASCGLALRDDNTCLKDSRLLSADRFLNGDRQFLSRAC